MPYWNISELHLTFEHHPDRDLSAKLDRFILLYYRLLGAKGTMLQNSREVSSSYRKCAHDF